MLEAADGVNVVLIGRSHEKTSTLARQLGVPHHVADFADPDANFCGSNSGSGATLPVPLMKPIAPTAAETAPWG